jgi:hypothetical protein
MKIKTQHTPTPWKFEVMNNILGIPLLYHINRGDIEVRSGLADAEFIVRAVNSHEALLETLKSIIESNSYWWQEVGWDDEDFKRATKLIAQAEGK